MPVVVPPELPAVEPAIGVLVNTRMVDRVLTEPDWAERLTEPDLRGLTPLFWSNVALHGTFELDLDKRLDYNRGSDPDPTASDPHAEAADGGS